MTSNSYTALRRDFMELADHLNVKRSDLLTTIHEINICIANLVSAADQALSLSVEEGLGGSKVTQLGYKTSSPSPPEIADFTNPKRTRTCSLCGVKGHDARTCTNGRKK